MYGEDEIRKSRGGVTGLCMCKENSEGEKEKDPTIKVCKRKDNPKRERPNQQPYQQESNKISQDSNLNVIEQITSISVSKTARQ